MPLLNIEMSKTCFHRLEDIYLLKSITLNRLTYCKYELEIYRDNIIESDLIYIYIYILYFDGFTTLKYGWIGVY